ncbi:hypothetical protein BCR39DRAFT_522800 [Naematelia encephala]|uniref:Uncharacterized protein n=1 Tax=Naematelia encephala TaxID=71784 RepID=A0A1Y2BCJ0_9TREE|nr:hypothetical protein BCR39DRAFT_522800 [Naematelia encephala]
MSTARSALFLIIASQLVSLVPTTIASPGQLGIAQAQPRWNVSGTLSSLSRRDSAGYNNPNATGGSMLTIVNGTYPAGLGEPLNVILSANSNKDVLVKSADDGGFLNYMLSTFMGEECLGQHLGDDQMANLGDGQGNHTQVEELRWDFGNPYIGTCQETFQGGLHLRYWVQSTTGAYFMATSIEVGASAGHDIVSDGYNLGRDYLVGNLTGTQVESWNVTNQTTYSGTSSHNNYTYRTDVQYVSGLLLNSSDGINHYLTVETSTEPAIDGLVAVLTVDILSRPTSSAFASLSSVSFGATLLVAGIASVLLLV